ncbi:MAG: type II toxin-antitoxin system death-on-curing family toxin [bacterium]|nr:type II toxin-antitoxin system death-on-curing family toxin [bacterium]
MNSKNGEDGNTEPESTGSTTNKNGKKNRREKGFYYLGLQDIININNEVTGGQPHIRDVHLLYSALRRPAMVLFGQPQFPTLYDKAAALMESLAYHHLFGDGNKRTAVQAVTLFFERNGYCFDYDPERDYEYVLEVAQGQHDAEQIAAWLQARARKDEAAG